MFASFFEKIHLQWECILEWYILKVDSATVRVNACVNVAHSKLETLSANQSYPNRLLQLTLLGIILTFTVLLFSCQTAPRPMAVAHPRKFDAARPERELDQLYIRRNELTIRSNETGSSTGSIWADAHDPRNLFTDATPSREGQTITVLIPEELQFNPRVGLADAETNKKNRDSSKSTKSSSETADKGAKETNSGLKFTNPDEASPAQKMAQTPIKSLKMQIVGFEPSGDVYLRGIKKYTSPNGEDNTTMVLAKVPRRLLTGYELDARDLTDVAVNENFAGRMSEFSSPGWDEMVSRRLAGFSPDLNTELATLDVLKDEIKTAQASLRDQAKANEMERERIRKERSRLSGENTSSNARPPAAVTSPESPTSPPPATANAAQNGDSK